VAQAEDDGSYEIDELILNWSYLAAIQRIRERSGCSLREALEALGTRIEQLRDEAPERFAPQPEGWEFYS
jgi:hypothetical protein